MNTQLRPQGGFASNVWLQFALLAIAVVVLIALAAKYIW
jgi:heme exporter protein D